MGHMPVPEEHSGTTLGIKWNGRIVHFVQQNPIFIAPHHYGLFPNPNMRYFGTIMKKGKHVYG
jgi:hypothetical protein